MWTSRNVAILAAAAALLATAVRAGEHGRDEGEEHEHGHRGHGRRERDRRSGGERAGPGPAVDPAYAKECGSCHVAFPPGLLPAASWTKLMAGLDRHFGQNAELDAEGRAAIERWLVARAGSGRGVDAPLRVTDTDRFRREHREVRGAAARPSIRSMANCAACHPGAERWDFDEDGVKIPRG